jgi:hypothetical protein
MLATNQPRFIEVSIVNPMAYDEQAERRNALTGIDGDRSHMSEATVNALTLRMFDKPLYCPVHGEVYERAFYFKNSNIALCGECVEKFLDNLKSLNEVKPPEIKKKTRYDIAKGKK